MACSSFCIWDIEEFALHWETGASDFKRWPSQGKPGVAIAVVIVKTVSLWHPRNMTRRSAPVLLKGEDVNEVPAVAL